MSLFQLFIYVHIGITALHKNHVFIVGKVLLFAIHKNFKSCMIMHMLKFDFVDIIRSDSYKQQCNDKNNYLLFHQIIISMSCTKGWLTYNNRSKSSFHFILFA